MSAFAGTMTCVVLLNRDGGRNARRVAILAI